MPNPNYAIYRQGSLRGDKIQYPDGISCCVWYPMCSYEGSAEDNEDTGICFDFAFSDLDDMIALLQQIKVAEANIYIPSDDSAPMEDSPEQERYKKEEITRLGYISC